MPRLAGFALLFVALWTLASCATPIEIPGPEGNGTANFGDSGVSVDAQSPRDDLGPAPTPDTRAEPDIGSIADSAPTIQPDSSLPDASELGDGIVSPPSDATADADAPGPDVLVDGLVDDGPPPSSDGATGDAPAPDDSSID